MGNRLEHIIDGALVGLGIYSLYKWSKKENLTLSGTVGSLIAGGLAGLLPDIIEPATNPNHRSFFHSKSLLLLIGYGNLKAWQSQQLSENQKLAITILSTAFGSHLVSDSTTEKSIPFLF